MRAVASEDRVGVDEDGVDAQLEFVGGRHLYRWRRRGPSSGATSPSPRGLYR